jgi:hypothetical protein
MSPPYIRCGKCIHYAREHMQGPRGYGTCKKDIEPEWRPVHANYNGCEMFVRVLTLDPPKPKKGKKR